MKALVQREFWEHRGAFIKTPIIISIVFLVLIVGGYFTAMFFVGKTGSEEITAQGINELTGLTKEQLTMFWSGELIGLSLLFTFVLFIVMFFYILGSLYNDRKDQSIMFWKSLPISDVQTVGSKLFTAMFVVPLVYMAVLSVLFVIILILVSIALLFHGLNPIQLVWTTIPVIQGVGLMLTGIFVQMIWALPIYGWLIFCSSFRKRRPFLFAVFVPATIALAWYWINMFSFKFTNLSMFKQPLLYLGRSAFPYISGAIDNQGHGSFNINFDDETVPLELIANMLSSLVSIQVIYGMVFAAMFIVASIWVRRYRNTT